MPSISNGLMPNSMPTMTRMIIAPPPSRMPPNPMPPPPPALPSGKPPVRSSTLSLRRKSPHRIIVPLSMLRTSLARTSRVLPIIR